MSNIPKLLAESKSALDHESRVEALEKIIELTDELEYVFYTQTEAKIQDIWPVVEKALSVLGYKVRFSNHRTYDRYDYCYDDGTITALTIEHGDNQVVAFL